MAGHIGPRGLDSKRFRLGPWERRELVLDVKPGSPFRRDEVEAAADRDAVLTVRADGAVIGGMTYRLDPTLERPANALELSASGGKRCVRQATRLLDCLDLPGQDVSSVRVKKITLEVSMKEDRE